MLMRSRSNQPSATQLSAQCLASPRLPLPRRHTATLQCVMLCATQSGLEAFRDYTIRRREFITRRGAGAALLILLPTVMAIGVVAAKARDDGQWADQPENVRQWFQSLKQPDH